MESRHQGIAHGGMRAGGHQSGWLRIGNLLRKAGATEYASY